MAALPLALSDEEKQTLAAFWMNITPEAESLGAEALYSLIQIYDNAKNHFSHFDLSVNSSDLRDHGGKVMSSFGHAIKNINNLPDAISDFNGMPLEVLYVDAQQFWCMCIAIQITLVAHYKQDFTGECLSAWTKFIYHLSNALADKRKSP